MGGHAFRVVVVIHVLHFCIGELTRYGRPQQGFMVQPFGMRALNPKVDVLDEKHPLKMSFPIPFSSLHLLEPFIQHMLFRAGRMHSGAQLRSVVSALSAVVLPCTVYGIHFQMFVNLHVCRVLSMSRKFQTLCHWVGLAHTECL